MTDTALEEALSPTPPVDEPAPQEAPVQEEAKPEDEPKGKVNDDGNITVPLAALHAERDARQKLAAEVEALKTATQPKDEPLQVPDIFEDPQGYNQYMDQRFTTLEQQNAHARLNDKLDLSESYATDKHGQDAVDKVKEWFATQPDSFKQEALGKANPYDYAIQQQKRQHMTEQLTSDPDKLERVLKMLEGKEQPAVNIPQTTLSDQSTTSRKGPEWSGPTPLDAIL